jgi:hypothetical protein
MYTVMSLVLSAPIAYLSMYSSTDLHSKHTVPTFSLSRVSSEEQLVWLGQSGEQRFSKRVT